MTRVKSGVQTKRRHKKVLKEASGYFGSKHRLYKSAKEQKVKEMATNPLNSVTLSMSPNIYIFKAEKSSYHSDAIRTVPIQ